MSHFIDRRDFLRAAGACGAAMISGRHVAAWAAAAPVQLSSPEAEAIGWQLSCSQYTFRSMGCFEAIAKIAELGIRGIEPAFFLPLSTELPNWKTNENLSSEMRQKLRERLDQRGMRMVNFYAQISGETDSNRKVFEFAKEMNVETLVAEPPADALKGIEKLCDEFQINLAIHNHPKTEGYQYWNPDYMAKMLQGMGKRIGACCDTGHWVRSGLDPVQCLKTMAGRIITIHLKDVIESGNPAARDVPLGEGKANFAAVLQELHRQAFRGAMSIEYEHESPQLMEDVAKCVAFVEKTVASW